jgi:hypothetical protein
VGEKLVLVAMSSLRAASGTDLPAALQGLMNSIQTQILTLPDETCYRHGPKPPLGKRRKPILHDSSLINNLDGYRR